MKCSLCGTETTELFRGKRIAVCHACVAAGRVRRVPPAKWYKRLLSKISKVWSE